MSGNDIAMQVTVTIEHPPRAERTFRWPPHVSPADVHAGFEGLPRRIGVYQASTVVRGSEVSLFVLFGRSEPTSSQIDRANAELRAARLG